MAMQMLFMHWRTVRFGMIPFVIAAFAVPLVLVQGMTASASTLGAVSASSAFSSQEAGLLFFPALAAAIGCVLALSAWNWDHKLGHVYALSLPVSRARYALMKFGAGAVLGLIPAAALFAGSLTALMSVNMPEGMHAYPVQLTGHFLFAELVLYALLFSMAAGTVRTTTIIASLVFGVPLLTAIGIKYLAPVFPPLGLVDFGYWLADALESFGPFRIFLGNWMLIDV